MSRKRNLTEQISLRLDDETDRLLTVLASQMRTTRVEAIRDAIKQTASDTSLRKIADRLEKIERLLSTVSSVDHIEKISKQLLDLAEGNNANANALAMVLRKVLERLA